MQKDQWKPISKRRKWTAIKESNEKDIHQHRAVSRKAKGIKAKEARSVWACRQRKRGGEKRDVQRGTEMKPAQDSAFIQSSGVALHLN